MKKTKRKTMAKAKTRATSRSKRSNLNKKFSKLSGKQILIFAVVFGLIGIVTMWKSLAAPLGICVTGTPGVFPQNSSSHSVSGTYGLPGQQLKYIIGITNYDKNCSASIFTLNVAAPAGFVVSNPSTTISVNSASQAFVTVYITSLSSAADGDNPITVTATRASTPSSSTATTYYRVYSSDITAPVLYWTYPGDGQTISAGKGKSGSYSYISFESQDDHAVKMVEVYVDNVLLSTVNCENISPECGVSYKWPIKGQNGQHTATFKAYDWKGNVGSQVNSFTVQ